MDNAKKWILNAKSMNNLKSVKKINQQMGDKKWISLVPFKDGFEATYDPAVTSLEFP